MNKMTDQQLSAMADEFEAGWSEERLDAAKQSWGPALRDVLPDDVQARLHERAQAEGLTEVQLITEALKAYLAA
ncbi:hypothetical protein ACWG8W_03260 [Citricoccus zhacaiensis]